MLSHGPDQGHIQFVWRDKRPDESTIERKLRVFLKGSDLFFESTCRIDGSEEDWTIYPMTIEDAGKLRDFLIALNLGSVGP